MTDQRLISIIQMALYKEFLHGPFEWKRKGCCSYAEDQLVQILRLFSYLDHHRRIWNPHEHL